MANKWEQDDNEQRPTRHTDEQNEDDNNFRIKFSLCTYYNNNRFFRKFGCVAY